MQQVINSDNRLTPVPLINPSHNKNRKQRTEKNKLKRRFKMTTITTKILTLTKSLYGFIGIVGELQVTDLGKKLNVNFTTLRNY